MKKFLILLLILLAVPSSFAIQEERKISLQDAIELAIRTNPQMELARLDVDMARNNILQTNRLQNPSIHTFQNIPKAGVGNPQQIGVDYTIELLKEAKEKKLQKLIRWLFQTIKSFLNTALLQMLKNLM